MCTAAAARCCETPHRQPRAQRATRGDAEAPIVRRLRLAPIATRPAIGGVNPQIDEPQIGPEPVDQEHAITDADLAKSRQFVPSPSGDAIVPVALRLQVSNYERLAVRRTIVGIE